MNDATKPAYFMVQMKAKNFQETMQRYGGAAIAMVQKFGGDAEGIGGRVGRKLGRGPPLSGHGNGGSLVQF